MVVDTNNWRLAAAISAAGALTAGILWSKSNQSSNSTIPQKWVRVGEVSNFLMYPVKSCQGVEVNEVTATTLGIVGQGPSLRDRIFLVVTGEGLFRTQRQLPKMALIGVAVNESQLTLTAPQKSAITINIPENKPETLRSCKIFDDIVKVSLDCGDAVGKWLSEFLEVDNLRLYYHVGDATQRAMTSLQKKFPNFVPSDKGSFQDQTSFMLMAEESLMELNKNLQDPVSVQNFRPSIMIKGIPEPFAEDLWSYVRIGNKDGPIFKASKPCTRCKLTTVNPAKGEFRDDGEPLSTLYKLKRSYGDDRVDKLVKNMAVLGIQMGLAKSGNSIRVGDPVYAAVL